jgi:hypothetical protein
MKGIFEQLEKLINEHGSAQILKERLDLAADQYAGLEKKANTLEAGSKRLRLEIDSLRKENADLKKRIEATEQGTEFRICKSMAFKKKSNGKFWDQPFCPNCHKPMSLLPSGCVRCAPCKHHVTLGNERLPEIASWLDGNPE